MSLASNCMSRITQLSNFCVQRRTFSLFFGQSLQNELVYFSSRNWSPFFLQQINKFNSIVLQAKMRPVVVCGPSGGGKSSLVNKLMDQQQFKNKFMFSVSHTTRSPRAGEDDGVAYHFTTKENFQKMLQNGEFLEWAEFGGNYYGTSKKAVADVGSKEENPVCLLDLEVNGVRQLKQLDKDNQGMNCFYIFITVPSMEILESRLRGRGTETEASIEKRLDRAKQDSEYGNTPGNFDIVIVNDSFDRAYKEFEETMLKANPHLAASQIGGGDASAN